MIWLLVGVGGTWWFLRRGPGKTKFRGLGAGARYRVEWVPPEGGGWQLWRGNLSRTGAQKAEARARNVASGWGSNPQDWSRSEPSREARFRIVEDVP